MAWPENADASETNTCYTSVTRDGTSVSLKGMEPCPAREKCEVRHLGTVGEGESLGQETASRTAAI